MTKIEKASVPAQPGLDPIEVYFEDYGPAQGRVTLICFDMAWTAYWGGMGSQSAKQFFLSCGVDYLLGNFGRGRQYKVDQSSQNYLRRVLQAAHDHVSKIEVQ